VARAFDRKRTFEFVPTCDRELPKDQQTTFILAGLGVLEISCLQEEFSKNPERPDAMRNLVEMARHALKGWKNFPLPDGSEAVFTLGPDGYPTIETIGQIGPREIVEIAEAASESTQVTKVEAGKS